MYTRFAAGLLLVILVSLAGTSIEKRNLALRRGVSRQHYRLEVLKERYAALKAEAGRLGATSRLAGELPDELTQPEQPAPPAQPRRAPGRHKRQATPAARPASASAERRADIESNLPASFAHPAPRGMLASRIPGMRSFLARAPRLD